MLIDVFVRAVAEVHIQKHGDWHLLGPLLGPVAGSTSSDRRMLMLSPLPACPETAPPPSAMSTLTPASICRRLPSRLPDLNPRPSSAAGSLVSVSFAVLPSPPPRW